MIELKPHGIEGFLSSYVLRGEHVALIDPGPACGVDALIEELGELGICLEEIRYVAATHIHIDHAGGVGRLFKRLPEASLLVHRRGASHVIDPRRLWRMARQALGGLAEIYGYIDPIPEEKVISLADGMNVDLGKGIVLKSVETPGHASHCVSFYEEKSRGVFTGDAAGLYLNPPRVTLPSTPQPFFFEEAIKSIDRLMSFKPDRVYYAHFGFTEDGYDMLNRYKEQLLLWHRIVGSMKNELNVLEIYEALIEEDEMIKAAKKALDSNSMFKNNLLLSINGFINNITRKEN